VRNRNLLRTISRSVRENTEKSRAGGSFPGKIVRDTSPTGDSKSLLSPNSFGSFQLNFSLYRILWKASLFPDPLKTRILCGVAQEYSFLQCWTFFCDVFAGHTQCEHPAWLPPEDV
jgi:hypothetical protein